MKCSVIDERSTRWAVSGSSLSTIDRTRCGAASRQRCKTDCGIVPAASFSHMASAG